MLHARLCQSLCLGAGLIFWAVAGQAEVVRIAVASNFLTMARILEAGFELETGHEIELSPGSTGALYAQIRHGAPFDLFLAADDVRPQQLAELGLTEGAPFTYATGRLVLWVPDHPEASPEILGGLKRVAIANPELAPYGRAAEEALRALGLWDDIAPAIVRGQNVSQAVAMIATGNAEGGLVAAAVLPAGAQAWPVPTELHRPIRQQAVVLADAPDAAHEFVALLQHPAVRRRMIEAGYAE